MSLMMLIFFGSHEILLEAADVHDDVVVLIAVDIAALIQHHVVIGELEMNLLLSLILIVLVDELVGSLNNITASQLLLVNQVVVHTV